MKTYRRYDFPVAHTRRLMEPGPVVLVSSAWREKRNIMTMGWHMMMEYDLIGCYVWTRDHSFEMIRKSGECILNVPEVHLAKTVVAIGNTHGDKVDKFKRFGLTALPAQKVKAPLIGECYASFECKLVDSSLIRKYSLFIFKVVKGHAARTPKYPRTIHYRGGGRAVYGVGPGNQPAPSLQTRNAAGVKKRHPISLFF